MRDIMTPIEQVPYLKPSDDAAETLKEMLRDDRGPMPVIRDFTIAMIWGVLIGCYSTVYVASPIVLHLHLRRPADEPATAAKSPDLA